MNPARYSAPAPDRAAAAGPLVPCPRCGEPALYAPANKSRPFCSERCKTIDLGAWANDEYSVPGDPLDSPLGDGEDRERG